MRRLFAVFIITLPLIAAPTVTVSAAAPVGTLINAGFENPYQPVDTTSPTVTGTIASNWADSSAFADADVAYGQGSGVSGSAQRIKVTALRDGLVQLYQRVRLTGGRSYRYAVQMRATLPVSAGVAVGQAEAPYGGLDDGHIQLTGQWQQVATVVNVSVTGDYNLYIQVLDVGDVFVDDATLTSTPGGLTPAPSLGPIAATAFGVHASTASQTTLYDNAFEGPGLSLGNTRPIGGVISNRWLDNSDWADVKVNYALDAAVRHGGKQSQRLDVTSIQTGRVQMIQYVATTSPASLTGSIWVRGTAGAVASLEIRRADPPFDIFDTDEIALSGTWQKLTVDAAPVPSPVNRVVFMVAMNNPGSLWVDDARFTRVDGKPITVPAPSAPVGTFRIWDGATWSSLEPSKGQWDFSRLDRIVKQAEGLHSQIVLTLGQTPEWASTHPEQENYYGRGAPAAPTDIGDWSRYVSTVAARYKGRIAYYEVWNEPNDPNYGRIAVPTLVAMTKAARDALLATDPLASLTSPAAYSIGWLDAFLRLGGGQYVDVVGYHIYQANPEQGAQIISDVRSTMALYKAKLPIWITEGGSGSIAIAENDEAALIARQFLVHLAYGAQRFVWFEWGSGGDIWGATTYAGSLRPNAAGLAYGKIQNWLVGSRMSKVSTSADGIWTIDLLRANGSLAQILWRTNGSSAVALPTAWRPKLVEQLNGTKTPIPPLAVSTLVGTSPVLLVP